MRTWRKCAFHTLGGRSPDSRLPTQQRRTPNRPSQGYCLIGVLGKLVVDSGGTVSAWLRTSRLSPNRLLQALRSVARYPAADHLRLFGVRDSDRGMGASNMKAGGYTLDSDSHNILRLMAIRNRRSTCCQHRLDTFRSRSSGRGQSAGMADLTRAVSARSTGVAAGGWDRSASIGETGPCQSQSGSQLWSCQLGHLRIGCVGDSPLPWPDRGRAGDYAPPGLDGHNVEPELLRHRWPTRWLEVIGRSKSSPRSSSQLPPLRN